MLDKDYQTNKELLKPYIDFSNDDKFYSYNQGVIDKRTENGFLTDLEKVALFLTKFNKEYIDQKLFLNYKIGDISVSQSRNGKEQSLSINDKTYRFVDLINTLKPCYRDVENFANSTQNNIENCIEWVKKLNITKNAKVILATTCPLPADNINIFYYNQLGAFLAIKDTEDSVRIFDFSLMIALDANDFYNLFHPEIFGSVSAEHVIRDFASHNKKSELLTNFKKHSKLEYYFIDRDNALKELDEEIKFNQYISKFKGKN